MSSASPDAAAQAQLTYAPNVLHNANLNSVKFISSCFSGAVAGILGLQNWLGFALFLASTTLTSTFIFIINCKGKPHKFLPGGMGDLVNPGQDNAFTFILIWTMFFGWWSLLSFNFSFHTYVHFQVLCTVGL
jgi:ER membrane protein complex subunit 6